MTTTNAPEVVEYPVCSACAAALVNADFSGHEGLQLDMLVCFIVAAGNLIHDHTGPVEGTDEWQCTGCHELCIGAAEFFTTP